MDGEGTTPDDLRINLTWPDADPDLDETSPEALTPSSGPRGPSAEALSGPAWSAPGPPRAEPRSPAWGEPTPETEHPLRSPDSDREGRQAAAVSRTPALPQPTESARASEPYPERRARRDPLASDEQSAARFSRIAEETSATRARIDTLTDAVITMRSFLNDRVGDVGQAVSRSEAQLTREISLAIDRMPAPVEVDVEAVIERSRTGLALQLRDALAVTRSQLSQELDDALVRLRPGEDLGEQVERLQEMVSTGLERAFSRLGGQVGRHVDEVIADARVRTVEEVERAVNDAQDRLVAHLDQATAASQRKAGQQAQELLSELERSSTTLGDLVTRAEATDAGIDRLGGALSTEVAAVAEALAGAIDRSAEAVRDETRSGNAQAIADIAELGESVAGALNQVASRLERLAARNVEQDDVVEAVADALDDVAQRVDALDDATSARHDEVVAALSEQRRAAATNGPELRNVTQGLADLEAAVAALRAATDRQRNELVAFDQAGERRVEQLLARPLTDPALVATLTDIEAAIEGLVETAEIQVEAIKANEQQVEALAARAATDPATRAALTELQRTTRALSASSERTEELLTAEHRLLDTVGKPDPATTAALATLEARLEDLASRYDAEAGATRRSLDGIAETVERLAGAQAEDLERLLDAVEAGGGSTAEAAAESVAEQLAAMSSQIEALRRRIAVRGRNPELSESAVALLADRLFDQMRAASSRPGLTAPEGRRYPRSG